MKEGGQSARHALFDGGVGSSYSSEEFDKRSKFFVVFGGLELKELQGGEEVLVLVEELRLVRGQVALDQVLQDQQIRDAALHG